MSDLELEIKTMIVEALELEDIAPEEIDTDADLFGDGLGLDSIDALELGLSLQKKYNIKLDANSADNKKHFQSVASLKAFIQSHQA